MFSLFDTGELERALNLCATRQNVISSNIANAHSADYEAQAVVFEEQIESVEQRDRGKRAKIRIVERPTVIATGGPVDIISEMSSLAKNQILYTAYSDRIGSVFKNLNWILDNTGR